MGHQSDPLAALAGPRVPHQSSQNQLEVDGARGHRAENSVAPILPGTERGKAAAPPGRGRDQGDHHHGAEKQLRETGMQYRYADGQVEQHGQAAQQGLGQDHHHCDPGQPPDSRTRLHPAQPDGQNHGQNRHRRGDQAVGMLIEHPSHHLRHETPVGEGPVRDRKAGIVAGDQGPRHQKEEGGRGGHHREPVDGMKILGSQAGTAS